MLCRACRACDDDRAEIAARIAARMEARRRGGSPRPPRRDPLLDATTEELIAEAAAEFAGNPPPAGVAVRNFAAELAEMGAIKAAKEARALKVQEAGIPAAVIGALEKKTVAFTSSGDVASSSDRDSDAAHAVRVVLLATAALCSRCEKVRKPPKWDKQLSDASEMLYFFKRAAVLSPEARADLATIAATQFVAFLASRAIVSVGKHEAHKIFAMAAVDNAHHAEWQAAYLAALSGEPLVQILTLPRGPCAEATHGVGCCANAFGLFARVVVDGPIPTYLLPENVEATPQPNGLYTFKIFKIN